MHTIWQFMLKLIFYRFFGFLRRTCLKQPALLLIIPIYVSFDGDLGWKSFQWYFLQVLLELAHCFLRSRKTDHDNHDKLSQGMTDGRRRIKKINLTFSSGEKKIYIISANKQNSFFNRWKKLHNREKDIYESYILNKMFNIR